MIKNTGKKAVNPRRKKDLIFYCCVLALPVLQFLIFYVCVNFNSVIMAFQELNVKGDSSWAGLSNFKRLFSEFSSNVALSSAWSNSFVAYFVGLCVGIPLALLFSYYIAKKKFGYNFFGILLFLPSILPTFSLSMIFRRIVDASIPQIFADMGITIEGLLDNYSTAFGTLLFYFVWTGFGGNVLLYVGAMRGISESVVEAAELDGAVGLKEFFYISLPLVYRTIVTFLITGIAGIFTNQLGLFNFYNVTAPEQLQTFGYYLYAGVAKAQGSLTEYPFYAAMGLFFTLCVAPTVFLAKYLLEKFGPSAG